ncbi:MAG TPA: 4-hydroxy-3-methylbut-2-enyl diphosphate reductase [Candidatus Nanopelagicaceae bacterium]|nr:4-hydroxy-3-methylbut-2-enyl diphosphate reductase [Candidatus Nanopelagicaceae bacterium]
MEVVKIRPRGYCHGVVEAIRALRLASEQHPDEPVVMLGHLVHNEHVTREFAERGVQLVDAPSRLQALEQVDRGTVVLTAHGVSPEVKVRALAKGLNVVDATCTDVIRTHDLVRRLSEDGYTIVYIGKAGHPEPEGVLGEAPEALHLVESVADVDRLEIDSQKLAVTTQTTLSVWDTQAIIARLQERFPNIEVHNEICNATQERQQAAVETAASCDLVIVVGSSRSSNSQRLVQVVRELAHRPAHLVDTAADLRPEWFQDVGRVGVTSGASTPTGITREVIAALEAMEAPAPAAVTAGPAPSVPGSGSAGPG